VTHIFYNGQPSHDGDRKTYDAWLQLKQAINKHPLSDC